MEVERIVQKEYNLNPALTLRFVLNGKLLSNDYKLSRAQFQVKKNSITVMALQSGGLNRLEMVLHEISENGKLKASLFSTLDGLVLASQKINGIDERVVAAMSSMVSDAAFKATEEMHLSEAKTTKIFCKDDYVVCRVISVNNGATKFLFAVLLDIPKDAEGEKYVDSLLDWADKNAYDDLVELAKLKM